jgi:hypothetical protein
VRPGRVESGYGLLRRPEDGGADDLLLWRADDEAVQTRLADVIAVLVVLTGPSDQQSRRLGATKNTPVPGERCRAMVDARDSEERGPESFAARESGFSSMNRFRQSRMSPSRWNDY